MIGTQPFYALTMWFTYWADLNRRLVEHMTGPGGGGGG